TCARLRLFGEVLEELLEAGQEACGIRAVHDAVIVAEREEGSLADRDRVHAVRRHDDRALLDRTGPENRGSALRDDGHADDRAEHAGIRDRERRTLDLVGLELALAGA